MILQLNPALPLKHVSRGNFLAHFIHDDGIESSILFTGFLDNGEIWTFNNRDLRAQNNITLGRTIIKNIKPLAENINKSDKTNEH